MLVEETKINPKNARPDFFLVLHVHLHKGIEIDPIITGEWK